MWETIIQVGGEGGRLILKGMKLKDGTWIFTRIKDETTLAEVLSYNDLTTLHSILRVQSNVVAGFENGVQLLNSAWPKLSVRFVHPEFGESVWAIVSQLDIGNHLLREWADVCFSEPSESSIRYSAVRRKK